MSVVITLEDIQAYAEVDYIIRHMNEKYIRLVPEKLRKFFSEYKDPTYEIKINPYVPLENQGLKKYTLEIIALLHLRYWCEDEKRRTELYNLMIKNEQKLESQIREKYDIENIFSKDFEEIEEPNQDFSEPRVIQKYEQYTKENEDIKDYTDLEEDNSLTKTNETINKNIWQIIKQKILSIFKK